MSGVEILLCGFLISLFSLIFDVSSPNSGSAHNLFQATVRSLGVDSLLEIPIHGLKPCSDEADLEVK